MAGGKVVSMDVISYGLGYRELSRLGDFLRACGERQPLIDFINQLNNDEVSFDISYDIHEDEPCFCVPVTDMFGEVLFEQKYLESDFN